MDKLRRSLGIGFGFLLCSMIFLSGCGNSNTHVNEKSAGMDKKVNSKRLVKKSLSSKNQKVKEVNWLLPTGGAYPKLGSNDPIWIKVSKAKQRVYIMKGSALIYTMVVSTGIDSNPETSTPEGTFYIQRERGTWFYSPRVKEGAKYWVSWKNHGEYLFHSVAMDENGNVITNEAKKLGHEASHGCVRLAIPDAKWIYDNIKYNTKVVIGS
ncbi:L,D-transpeptidase [Bacillus salipaludis]|uniref:L,D-transpeptidase n=1 Tax=Bacillus salipaludis TaxID=2547811 RepID=A0AA90TWR6_9BACI|nr:L,D-transpeptidase [Bacillus salipaludis]MDQ6600921.1 L,D-transpeptidase [Bacillus salipaludis]